MHDNKIPVIWYELQYLNRVQVWPSYSNQENKCVSRRAQSNLPLTGLQKVLTKLGAGNSLLPLAGTTGTACCGQCRWGMSFPHRNRVGCTAWWLTFQWQAVKFVFICNDSHVVQVRLHTTNHLCLEFNMKITASSHVKCNKFQILLSILGTNCIMHIQESVLVHLSKCCISRTTEWSLIKSGTDGNSHWQPINSGLFWINIITAIIKLKLNDISFLKKWVIVQKICIDMKCTLHTNLQLPFQTYSDVNIWQKTSKIVSDHTLQSLQ